MLTIAECKKYLEKYELTDNQVEEIRNTLYCITENVINKYLNTCKKP